ncbi:hypothetical protein BH10PSE12_BH10PSE12_07740 [soil metagenome]
MAIPDAYRRNFDTLRRAAQAGDLALLECRCVETGEPRYVICAVGREENGDAIMTPFGHLHDGNPFEAYVPPAGDAGDA